MLKNRDKLLTDITSQLHKYENNKIANIRVVLFKGKRQAKEYLGLAVALNQIVEGLYWDDAGDWRDADRAEVDTY